MKISPIGLISLALLSTGAYAEYSFSLANTESCESIAGSWSGKGKATNWLLGSCTYYGTGIVSIVDNTGHFSVRIIADKDYGNKLCPEHATEQLNGVCLNGVVTIKTDFGSLKGNFSENNGSAKGTLSVSPGIDADVSIHLFR